VEEDVGAVIGHHQEVLQAIIIAYLIKVVNFLLGFP
jgi:hypothetical protein